MTRLRHRHLIWDWNGTLLDDLDLSLSVMNAILARRALPRLDRARYHTLFDFPVRTYYGRLGFDPARDSFEQLSVEFISGYDARRLESTLHRDARRLLGAARDAGLRQSILSAYRQETLREIVAHFGLDGHFDHIAGLDNIHAHSKLDLGRDLIRRLDTPPGEILLVGDTLHDLEVARELGVDCALIAAGHHPADRLQATGAPVYPDLAAFAAAHGL
ncbi:MAG: HAD family hydrolase [Verrucomicrobia bacterium]|nr:HAD family hydrolase [Verrucomicrobiota bacterium]